MSWKGVSMRFAEHITEFMIFRQNATHVNMVSESLESNLETDNLNTCTSGSREAHAKATTSMKVILAVEFGVPEAGIATSGGAKDLVSFGGWNKMLPNTQSINRL